MRKAPSHAIFLAFLIIAAVVSFSAIWFRSAETPPWQIGSAVTANQPEPPSSKPSGGEETASGEFSFLTYNVKNWLVSNQVPEKSPNAKEAVIRIIATAAPDVIGLSEIGGKEDLSEIQDLLKREGLDFPHTHRTGGVDPVRHLALLSRYPIVSTRNPDPRIAGSERAMQRGILDATVRIHTREIRFIGIHLKSKRSVQKFDQALLRIQEAGHVRKHIDGIFAADQNAMLVVYGDFNDTTRTLSTRTIYGAYRTPGYLSPVPATDSRGETWTYRYAVEDSYSRIDFVTVSAAMKRHLKRDKTRIIDDPLWSAASDHRPVVVGFGWED